MRGYFITQNGQMGYQSVLGPVQPKEEDDTVAASEAVKQNDIWLADQLEDWESDYRSRTSN